MGTIVNHGRRIAAGQPHQGMRSGKSNHLLHLALQKPEGGQVTVATITSNRKATIVRFMADLGLIQEHFGNISRSAAGRLAIALTANAIRSNKALPNVRHA